MQHIEEPLDRLFAMTDQVILALLGRGYRRFICGGATGFDTIAASSLVRLRAAHPEIRLILALPCADQTSAWSDQNRVLHETIRAQADQVITLSPHYYRGCMMVRNRFMVDHADFCVAYYRDRGTGGTLSTIRMAMHRGLPVLNLAVPGELARFLRETESLQPLPF